MPTYKFSIELSGTAETPEEAWEDAFIAFAEDPGVTPPYSLDEGSEEGGLSESMV